MSDDVAVRSVDQSRSVRWRGARRAGRWSGVVSVTVAVTTVALLGVTGCSRDDRAEADHDVPATTSVPDHVAAPELADAACPDPSTPVAVGRITCLRLVLPEDRAFPEDRQVELPVLRVRPSGDAATTPSTAGGTGVGIAPVVYLHGGPGGGAAERWATWSTLVDALGTEIVVYDQRGGGAAVPRLDCPEHADAVLDALAVAGDPAGERDAVAASLAECHDRLADEGIGLDHYDVPTSVADLDDLRAALGVERLRLVASSYGTRLALEYAAAHPDRVESMALDSIDPPGSGHPGRDAAQVDPAIDRLLDACHDDAACARTHPDLRAALDAAVARVERSPLVIELPATDDRPAGRVAVTGDDLLAGLFAAMYDSELIPLLPMAIDAIAAGDDALLASLGPRLAPALSSGATGTLMSVNCAALPTAPPPSSEVGVPPGSSTVALTGWDTFCHDWPVPRDGSDATVGDPPVPVLVVAGELDPITPAATSTTSARRWGATYLELPRAGHAPMLVDACARSVLRSFLADPTAPDLTCTTERPTPPFA